MTSAQFTIAAKPSTQGGVPAANGTASAGASAATAAKVASTLMILNGQLCRVTATAGNQLHAHTSQEWEHTKKDLESALLKANANFQNKQPITFNADATGCVVASKKAAPNVSTAPLGPKATLANVTQDDRPVSPTTGNSWLEALETFLNEDLYFSAALNVIRQDRNTPHPPLIKAMLMDPSPDKARNMRIALNLPLNGIERSPTSLQCAFESIRTATISQAFHLYNAFLQSKETPHTDNQSVHSMELFRAKVVTEVTLQKKIPGTFWDSDAPPLKDGTFSFLEKATYDGLLCLEIPPTGGTLQPLIDAHLAQVTNPSRKQKNKKGELFTYRVATETRTFSEAPCALSIQLDKAKSKNPFEVGAGPIRLPVKGPAEKTATFANYELTSFVVDVSENPKTPQYVTYHKLKSADEPLWSDGSNNVLDTVPQFIQHRSKALLLNFTPLTASQPSSPAQPSLQPSAASPLALSNPPAPTTNPRTVSTNKPSSPAQPSGQLPTPSPAILSRQPASTTNPNAIDHALDSVLDLEHPPGLQPDHNPLPAVIVFPIPASAAASPPPPTDTDKKKKSAPFTQGNVTIEEEDE